MGTTPANPSPSGPAFKPRTAMRNAAGVIDLVEGKTTVSETARPQHFTGASRSGLPKDPKDG